MYKTLIYIFILVATFTATQAKDSLCTIDKLYFGQVQFDNDSLENKSYEFYMHLPVGMESTFYFRELADKKYRKLFLNVADNISTSSYYKDSITTRFHFGDAEITLDTNYSLEMLSADMKIRRKFSKGIGSYDRDDSIRIIMMSQDPEEIAETIKVLETNYIIPRPLDRMNDYWATVSVLPGRNEFSFQGNYFSYMGKFDSEPYPFLTFTFPNISVVYDKNGFRRYSYQAAAIPLLGGIAALSPLIDHESSVLFWAPGFIFGFLSAISNPGVDFHISGIDNYFSFYCKLNWDILIVEVPDIKDYKQPDNFFVEPKIGFRYLNVRGFGFEAFAGYRIWNFPLTLSHEHAFAGVAIIIPIADLD